MMTGGVDFRSGAIESNHFQFRFTLCVVNTLQPEQRKLLIIRRAAKKFKHFVSLSVAIRTCPFKRVSHHLTRTEM
jgi:hypothetical protein